MRLYREGDLVQHDRYGPHEVVANQREGGFVRVACTDCGGSAVGASELTLIKPAD
ncbi:hypothetical protein [Jiangella anatolica]|uniref:hypothetical protein n=1 Tax=Jiangella anatolica TaxID=2670374 RepID=UPI0013141157|nr:hypothetical protein [Jiangella anatolica]